jgi:xanthine dehydrogenase accessory factor
VTEDQIARIDSPAGLDIGARSAAEIAVSILASVVMVRRGRSDEELGLGASRDEVPEPLIVVDPICGMTVVVVPGTPSAQSDSDTAYFCCEGCKEAYERQRQAA